MDRAYAKRQMVRQQIRPSDVSDERTLDLLSRLDRHRFVPEGFADLAYAELRIPLPHDQEMMTPLTEGRLLQAIQPGPADSIYEIGSGSGFLTACLASLAQSVVSVDIYDELVEMAGKNLERAGIDNVELRQADATRDYPDGSFDAIAVTGSMAEFDERLVALLKPDGRLFAIVGNPPVMEAWLVRRNGDGWVRTVVFETCIRPLVNAGRKSTFSF